MRIEVQGTVESGFWLYIPKYHKRWEVERIGKFVQNHIDDILQ